MYGKPVPLQRVQALRAYQPFFRYLLHLGESKGWPAAEVRNASAAYPLFSRVADLMPAIDVRTTGYTRLEAAHTRMKADPSFHDCPPDGLLAFHADFWVNPTRLLGLDLARGWLPVANGRWTQRNTAPNGLLRTALVTGCHWFVERNVSYRANASWAIAGNGSSTVATTEGVPLNWHIGNVLRARSAVRALCDRGTSGGRPGLFHSLSTCERVRRGEAWPACTAWSDLLYVPARWLPAFFGASRVFGAHRVTHEVAVPTIMHLAAEALDETVGQLSCAGCCCCAFPANRSVFSREACGHRLNLMSPADQRHLRAALEGHESPLSTHTASSTSTGTAHRARHTAVITQTRRTAHNPCAQR